MESCSSLDKPLNSLEKQGYQSEAELANLVRQMGRGRGRPPLRGVVKPPRPLRRPLKPWFRMEGSRGPKGSIVRPEPSKHQSGGIQVLKTPRIPEGIKVETRTGLRPIVIDGPNVAMDHGKNKVFSAKGIKIVVDHFKKLGHSRIVAFVPQLWKTSGRKADRVVLKELEEEGVVVFIPSRKVDGKRINYYDDTYVLDYAVKHGAVVVTKDNYRDLAHRKSEWMEVVKNRILMPTFVGEDEVMWPHDPLGRGGLTLDQFLSF